MAKLAEDERAYCHVLRVVMISFIKGNAPILAVEIGRRAIPGHLRPTFLQAEEACRGTSQVAAEAEPEPEAGV
jgi:chemotaxis protein MotA